MAQIFVTHSQKDQDILSFFGTLFGTTRVKGVFKELEGFRSSDSSAEINYDIQNSAALFVLLGPHMNNIHHTRDWCIWESARGKEVWIFEPYEYWGSIDVIIPHIDHYVPYFISKQDQDLIRKIIESYDDTEVLPTALALGTGGASLGGGFGIIIESILSKTNRFPLIGTLLGLFFGGLIGGLLGINSANPLKNRPVGHAIQCPSCHQTYNVYKQPKKMRCPCCNTILQWK